MGDDTKLKSLDDQALSLATQQAKGKLSAASNNSQVTATVSFSTDVVEGGNGVKDEASATVSVKRSRKEYITGDDGGGCRGH